MKYLVFTLAGDMHEVEAHHTVVDASGALWFYSATPAFAPDKVVRCFSSRYWSQFRPAQEPGVAPTVAEEKNR